MTQAEEHVKEFDNAWNSHDSNIKSIEDLAKKLGGALEQDWDQELTRVRFADGSVIVIDWDEVSVAN